MVATRLTTIEEFASTPREGLWELIDGEVVEMNPTSGRSGRIGLRIGSLLDQHVTRHGLGWAVGADTGFVLFPDRDTVRSPDAAVVLRERLDDAPETFVPLAPDLAVEVLSPTDRRNDALAKITMYLQAGVRLIWLVDPKTETVTVYQPDSAPRIVRGHETLDGGAVLPEFRLSLAEVFD